MLNFPISTNINKFISQASEGLVYLLAITLPLVFLPLTQTVFESPKQGLIILVTLLMILAWVIKTLVNSRATFTAHPFVLPLTGLIVAITASSIFGASMMISQSLSGTFGIILFLSLLVLIGANVIEKISEGLFLELLISAGIILTIISGLEIAGMGPTLMLNSLFSFQFPSGFQFSPSGSPLITLSFLIPVLVGTVLQVFSKKNLNDSLFQIFGAVILVIGIGIHVFMLAPGQPHSPRLLPFNVNWAIAIDMMKAPGLALFGIGPNGFQDAYTALRPVGMNSTSSWNVLFQTGSNSPLTFLVSLGILGLIAWLFFAFKIIKIIPQIKSHPVVGLILTTLVVQLFIPDNTILLTIQFLSLLVLIVKLKQHHSDHVSEIAIDVTASKISQNYISETKTSSVSRYVLALLGLTFVVVSGYYALKGYVAEVYAFEAMKSVQQNNGTAAYRQLQQAIKFNRYNDTYHRTYAQINLGLANSLSSQAELSDTDRATVAQLLQQAIREARIAAQLNPRRTANWRMMAEVYRSLIGGVEQADQFTIASYAQAIQTSATDPTLRIELGGVLLRLENPTQAIEMFMQAARLKPDYANAYYNWAQALIALEQYPQSKLALERTLALLSDTANSDQYRQVTDQLAEVNQLIEEQSVSQESTEASEDLEQIEGPAEVESPEQPIEEESLLSEEPNLEASAETEINQSIEPQSQNELDQDSN